MVIILLSVYLVYIVIIASSIALRYFCCFKSGERLQSTYSYFVKR